MRRERDGRIVLADDLDTLDQPCYDMKGITRSYDFISSLSKNLNSLGWGNYANDHEDANGQFELNFEYDDAIRTADKAIFFRYMVHAMAQERGLLTTFMPKPFSNLTGNGGHLHISLWDPTGKKNLFEDPKGELGLSSLAYQFIGGIVHSAESLCALTNPTVNSYKRINAPRTTSGATWAPNTVTYTGNNRTHMIRIPDAGRFEFRLPYRPATCVAMVKAGENEREHHQYRDSTHLPHAASPPKEIRVSPAPTTTDNAR